MIDNILNEMLIASRILHTNVVSRIAEEIGYRPMLIITALHRGNETGKAKYIKKKDIIEISEDVAVDKLQVTEGMRELIDLMEQFITYLNNEETDMTVEELIMLLGGTPDLHIKIAATVSDKLAMYEIPDPKDKESVYTFITLKDNLDKEWGRKQFNAEKSKARQYADQVVKEGKKALKK